MNRWTVEPFCRTEGPFDPDETRAVKIEKEIFWPAREKDVPDAELRAEARGALARPRHDGLGPHGQRVAVFDGEARRAAGRGHDDPCRAGHVRLGIRLTV